MKSRQYFVIDKIGGKTVNLRLRLINISVSVIRCTNRLHRKFTEVRFVKAAGKKGYNFGYFGSLLTQRIKYSIDFRNKTFDLDIELLRIENQILCESIVIFI